MFSKTLEWQSVTKLRDGNATADQKHLHDGKWRNTREKAMKLLVMIGCFFSSDSCLICLCYGSWLCLCYDILDCIRSQICCRFQLHCTNNIAGNKQHGNWKMSFYFKGLTQHDSLPLKIICIFIAVFKKEQFTCSFPFACLCRLLFFLLQTPPSVQTSYLGWLKTPKCPWEQIQLFVCLDKLQKKVVTCPGCPSTPPLPTLMTMGTR